MIKKIRDFFWKKAIDWLLHEPSNSDIPSTDFERFRYEIRPSDVILVEGRTCVSSIIKSITLSPWTHSALYIGRLHDIDDPAVRERILLHYPAEPDEQLVIEALLGQGTVISPLTSYQTDHLRVCRPTGLSRRDAQNILQYATNKLGSDYDVRQLLDLARFLFPYGLLPKRWRSTLFEHNAGEATNMVCSTMMAEAFSSVKFPVLPVMRHDENGTMKLHKRNSRLITPKDFDYSPYFDVIKYPVLGTEELELYRQLPWDENGVILSGLENTNEKANTEQNTTIEDTVDDASYAAKQASSIIPQQPSIEIQNNDELVDEHLADEELASQAKDIMEDARH